MITVKQFFFKDSTQSSYLEGVGCVEMGQVGPFIHVPVEFYLVLLPTYMI